MKHALVLLLLALPAGAQESHRFWDRQNTAAFAVTAGVRAADAAQTCYHLQLPPQVNPDRSVTRWREKWAPTQSCAGNAAWQAGGQAGQTLAVYLAHRRGMHKLERVLPWIWVTPNAVGIAVSFRTWRKKN